MKINIWRIQSNHLYVEVSYYYHCMDICINCQYVGIDAQGTVVNPPLLKCDISLTVTFFLHIILSIPQNICIISYGDISCSK